MVLFVIAHNKDQLLEQGILDYLLPYMDTEGSVVTSKLVGVLRLLVDKHGKHCYLILVQVLNAKAEASLMERFSCC